MARRKRRRGPQPTPPPLPPATRTVGQLVAETIRLYGRSFWRSLALGIAPAAAGLALAESPGAVRLALAFTIAAAAASLSFALATGVVSGERLPRRRLAEDNPRTEDAEKILDDVEVGMRAKPHAREVDRRRAIARAFELARADFAHAVGSLATLALVGLLTAYVLFFTLRSAGTAALRASAFVSVLVISPLLFLGGAILYYDQVARVGSAPRRRRRNADVHPAVQSDPPGRSDAQVEPGPAARSQ